MNKKLLRIFSVASVIATTGFNSQAATFSVTNTNDAGAGSLRQAVIDANTAAGADTIYFSGLTLPATISLTSGEITVTQDLVMTGPGFAQLSISGAGSSRSFFVNAGINFTMKDVTIKDGGNVFAAGGVYSDGNFTAKNCRFTANFSMGYGAAIGGYNGIFTLDSCLIDSNTEDGPGAVFVGNGQLNISYCTFMNNMTNQSRGAAIYVNSSSLNVYGSTFSGNLAVNEKGGAIGGQESPMSITNTTFSGNTSSFGGAALTLIDYGAGTSSLTLMNVTVASSTGAAIFVENGGGIPVFTTTNSIFSNAVNYSSAGTVTPISNGYNISSDATMSAILTSTGDMNSTDPLLQPLANNGGPTLTHAISCSSPAVNAGTSALAPLTDQRGFARVGNTDIGAYENTLTPAAPYNVSATICQGDVYTVGNSTYTASGTYDDTLVAVNTCDSIIITTLTVLNSTSSTLTTNACNSYNWNGNTYTVSGTYMDTIPNAAGCDSIMTLTLTILNSTSSTLTQTSCDSYTLNGTTYTSSGIYTQMTTNAAGCDSTITLNLTINTVDVSVTSVNETITANASGATYQWLDCNNSFAPISNETNQSFIANANGDFAVEITENGCTDTSACTPITSVTIKEMNNDQAIGIYPNPAIDQVNCEFNLSAVSEAHVVIVNSAGQLLYKQSVTLSAGRNTMHYNVKEFARGIYFLKITTGNSVFVKRFVLQ